MALVDTFALGPPPWPTFDPFLFCVHHQDSYPSGNEALAPSASLAGRQLGMDFSGRDGWSMYHGTTVPGFPQHPHRGFETVTVARRGFIDHSDSLGARARFGNGDAQWMTAGRGIVHAEMFPLIHTDRENPTELFQLWLNLPRQDKLVDPYFTMLWSEQIPTVTFSDRAGRRAMVSLVAGALGDARAPAPPPDSWAARPQGHVAIWSIRLEPGAEWSLPPALPGLHRTAYYFVGDTLVADGKAVPAGTGLRFAPDAASTWLNGPATSELLFLQGAPIGEPVFAHGPFVMNSPDEIRQAVDDYRRTGFGGWPYDRPDPVHGRRQARFARHADGRVEGAETEPLPALHKTAP